MATTSEGIECSDDDGNLDTILRTVERWKNKCAGKTRSFTVQDNYGTRVLLSRQEKILDRVCLENGSARSLASLASLKF